MEDKLIETICSHYDSEDLVKLLEISPEELLEQFWDRFKQMEYKFSEEV